MMSAAHDISPNVLKYMYVKYLLDLIDGVWGAKLSFSDGRAVCSTISQVKCSTPILAWNFLHAVHTYMALFVNASW